LTQADRVRAGEPLRIGLVGCGKMGMQHLRAIRALGGAQVVGIADPQADREQIAELVAPNALFCDDAMTLLREALPDVVHIVTPPGTHAELARQAIEAGCHVYVEKPFTPTAREAEALLSMAAARGVIVCPGHQYLFERPALLTRTLLASIGRLMHVESYFSFNMVRRTITRADQAKDILPHAVYPLVDQLRQGSGLAEERIEIKGLDVRASGDIYALLGLGSVTGVLAVTLNGRPIEQYQHLVGTNGSLRADYITGGVTRLTGTGVGPGVLLTPYRRAFQTLSGATVGFARLIFGRRTSYPGLTELLRAFYASVRSGGAPPLTPRSIIDTVDLCEQIGRSLDAVEQVVEQEAESRLKVSAAALPSVEQKRGTVFVTGGTGLLGRKVAEELRHAGFAVRVGARRLPRFSVRLPGVEYRMVDLARGLDATSLQGVSMVVHCAAETAGGKDDHVRNSINASRHVIEAAAVAGVARVIHVSSLAVLKPGHQVGGGPLRETSPIDAGNLERGPYVWGKAESEVLVQRLAREAGIDLRIVRPGPLVDYAAFHPPGRLGRELGPWFVAIGGKQTPLSVCDVGTAARVIRSYAEDFDAAPALVNLVESPPPTRRELMDRYLAIRPDLKARWVPGLLLRVLNAPAKLAQRLLMGSAKPVDVYAAFASERYDTTLAGQAIVKAGPSAIRTNAHPPVLHV
jgi:predicted dehydrogenase/nucleoside-diphosphate-sugar epimerase